MAEREVQVHRTWSVLPNLMGQYNDAGYPTLYQAGMGP